MNAMPPAQREPSDEDEHEWEASLFDSTSGFDEFEDGDTIPPSFVDTSVKKPAE